MAKDDIELKIKLDDKDYQKSANRVEKANDDIGKSGKQAGKDVQDGAKKGSVAWGSFAGNLAAMGVTAVISGIANAASGLFNTFVTDGIKAAQVQEQALNKVSTAMKQTGEFTQDAMDDMASWASQLQSVSTVGDETSLEMVALAKSFGLTNKEAKKVVETSVDLAAATGQDLKTAVEQVSGTFNGTTGRLGKLNPALKDLSKEALAGGAAVEILGKQFSGSAAAELETYAGKTTSMQNAFGDLTEEIGFLITQNPALLSAFDGISDGISDVIKWIQNNKQEISSWISKGINIAIKAAGYLWDRLKLLWKGFSTLIDWIKPLVPVLGVVAKAIGQVWNFVTNLRSGLIDMVGTGIAIALEGFESLVNGAIAAYNAVAGIIPGMEELNDVDFSSAIKNVTKATDTVIKMNELMIIDFNDEVQEASKKTKTTTEKENKAALKTVDTDNTNHVNVQKDRFARLEEDKAAKAKVENDKKLAKQKEDEEKAATERAKKQKEIEVANQKAILEAQEIADKEYWAWVDAEEKRRVEEKKKQIETSIEYTNTFLSNGLQGVASKALSSFADTFLPGVGGVVGQVFDMLSQDSDAFTKQLDSMLSATFIENITKNIPILVEKTIEALPDIVFAMIKLFYSPKFQADMVGAIAKGFVGGIKSAASQLADVIKKAVQDAIGAVTGLGGGGTPGFVKKLDPTSWFAEGGIVPGMGRVAGDSLTNDIVPAMLSPGEAVIPRSAMAKPGVRAFVSSILNGTQNFANGGVVQRGTAPISLSAASSGGGYQAPTTSNIGAALAEAVSSLSGDIVVAIDGREVARAVRNQNSRGYST